MSEQDSNECPCHVSPEELDDANRSLERCLSFAIETGNTTLQELLEAALQNNRSEECPPVVLYARGPH
jgi:hypothetical protein